MRAQPNVPEPLRGKLGYSDTGAWVAVDADTKLIVSYLIGLRSSSHATDFMRDVSSRIVSRIQLTSDGLDAYTDAVENAFFGNIDYAQLIKVYGPAPTGPARYRLPRARAASDQPRSRSGTYLHTLRGTVKPHNENVHAALHPSSQWIQQED